MLPNLWTSRLNPFFETFTIVFQIIAATFLVYFTDKFEGTISAVLTTLALFSVIFNETITMITPYYVDGSRFYNLSELIGIVVLGLTVLIGYWVYQELLLSEKNTISQIQIRQIRLMKIGIVLVFFIAPFSDIIGAILAETRATILGFVVGQLASYLLAGTGIGFIGLSYTYYDNIAFLQPEPIKSVLVIHDTGIPLFRHEFQKANTPIGLISGAISAVTSLMTEAFEVRSNLKGIFYQEEEILVAIKNDLAFILFIGHKSQFLERALEKFADTFYEKYNDKVENFTGDVTVFDAAINEFKTSFGLGSIELLAQ